MPNQPSKPNPVVDIARKIKQRYPSSEGRCSIMSDELVKEYRKMGMDARHVTGTFELDYPEAWKYSQNDDQEDDTFDDTHVNHDWVDVGGVIIDVSIDQFQPSMDVRLPKVGFLQYDDDLFNRYKEYGEIP